MPVLPAPPALATTTPPADTFAAPDLDPARVLRFTAGVRPFRTGRVRIEGERLGDKLIIHNYGHGGAGITLCWGSAEEVVRILRQRRPFSPHAASRQTVAVLGAGVIGLTAAHELLLAGCRVVIYAASMLENTTSWIAGGQWAPSVVARGNAPGDSGFFNRLLRSSHARFSAMAGASEWGVSRRPNFVYGRGGGGLRHIPSDLVAAEPLERLPLHDITSPGMVYHTMLIEPPTFLPRLLHEVRSRGGEVIQRRFTAPEELHELPEPVIVNCLGLGAGAVFADSRMVPIRGQLVHLHAQDLPYLLCHDDGYIFPRSDVVVVGGTLERGVDSQAPQEQACLEILERNRRFLRRPAVAAGPVAMRPPPG